MNITYLIKTAQRVIKQAALATAAFVLIASPVAQAANGTAYYFDSNGTLSGFGTPSGTIADSTCWTTDITGVATPVARTAASQLTFGNLATDLANSTFTVTMSGTLSIGGIRVNSTSADITLGGGGYVNGVASDWYVATGSTLTEALNYSGIGGMNWGSVDVSLSGGGTINFTTTPGVLGAGKTITQSGPVVNMKAAYTYTLSASQTHYTLTAGTLNFATASAANVFKGLAGNSGSVTLSGGTVDNTSGSPITLDLKGGLPGQGIIKLGGDFTFTGSSDLSFGTTPVTLTATPQITVTANNLSIGGPISGGYGLTKAGNGKLSLSGVNLYTGATTVNVGTLVGVTGGSSAGSAVTVASTGTLGVNFTGGNAQWTCASLTCSGTPALEFAFSTAPSTTTAPLNVIGDVTFTATPTITVAAANLSAGTYPLLVVGGSAPSAVPAVTIGRGLSGTVAWGGTGGKTLILTVTGTTAEPLTWNSSGTGTWDVNNSGNTIWKDASTAAAYYQEVGLSGDAVVFSDSNISADTTVTLNSAVNPAAVTVNNSTYNYTISGTGGMGGPAALAKSGTGTLTLSGANGFSGALTVSAGTLNLNNQNAAANSTVTMNGGTAALVFNSAVSANAFAVGGLAASTSGTGYDISLRNSGNTAGIALTLAGSGNSTYAGILSGTGGSLIKSGLGTQTLSGANTFSGGVTLSGGQLNINSASALGTSAGTFVINWPARIDNTSGSAKVNSGNNPMTWNGGFTFVGSADLDLGTGAVTRNNNPTITVLANTLTVGGTLSASLPLYKDGSGTLKFINTVTQTHPVNLYGGTLLLDYVNRGSAANLMGAGAPTFGGGTLSIKSKGVGYTCAQTHGNVTVSAGGGQLLADNNGGTSTTITLGTLTATTAGGSLLVGSAGANNTGLTITTTSGTLANGIYNGRVVYTPDNGTTVDWATTATSTPFVISALPGGSYTTLPDNAPLLTDTLNYITAASTTTTLAANRSHNTLKLAAGTTLALGSTTLTLTGGGLLSVGSTASTISGTAGATRLTTANNGDLVIHQYNTGGLTIGAVIGNTGTTTLTKAGPGTLTLTATETYTGATSVNSGTLLVNGSLSTGAVTVYPGGTLGGSGTVNGAVTMKTCGTLQPSVSGGVNTLTLASATSPSFGTATKLKIRVPTASTTDQVYLSNAGAVFACDNVDLVIDASGLSARTFTLPEFVRVAMTSGGISGTFRSVTVINNGNEYVPTVTYNANTITLTLTSSLPPPGMVLLLY